MKIDPATGLLDIATYVASPNHDVRPPETVIDLLVIHGISLPPGQFGGPYISDLFTNNLNPGTHPYFQEISGLRVSAHLLILRDGGVNQYVPFQMRAWHAGKSEFAGRIGCNDFSIGIELEGTDDVPYEAAQYARLAAITRALMQTYPGITRDHIVGHSDIAPGRKTDPGPYFDWARFFTLVDKV
ncbi:MAG: 1,6-anhydro-N-acetylmuramyl-L-alanine amidase AmpD [Pseudomonadota bacterium]